VEITNLYTMHLFDFFASHFFKDFPGERNKICTTLIYLNAEILREMLRKKNT
jgi:hypothetical protein